MINWVDILGLIIIIIFAFLGYKKGLINSIFGICAFIICIVLSYMFNGQINDILIKNTKIDDYIYLKVDQQLSLKSKNQINTYLEKIPISENFKNSALEINNNIKENDRKESINYISKGISNTIVSIIGFIILYFSIFLTLLMFKKVLNKIFDLPILAQINGTGGLAIGIIKAIIITYLFAYFVLFMNLSNQMNGIAIDIKQSKYVSQLYNFNPWSHINTNKVLKNS